MILVHGIFRVLDYIIGIYIWILFISAILRIVNADPRNTFVRMFHSISEPPCRWVLRKFPRLMFRSSDGSYMDFSGFAVMLGLGAIRILLPYIEGFITSF